MNSPVSHVRLQQNESVSNKWASSQPQTPKTQRSSSIGRFRAQTGPINTESTKQPPQPEPPARAESSTIVETGVKITKFVAPRLGGMLKRVGQAVAHNAKCAVGWGFDTMLPNSPPGSYEHLQSEEQGKTASKSEEIKSGKMDKPLEGAGLNQSDEFLERLPEGVSKEEILKIRKLITPKLKTLSNKAKAGGGATKLSRHKMTQLPKSVTITAEGKVYIHTKVKLGKGLEKTVKLNLEVFSGEQKVRMSDSRRGEGVKEWVTKEPMFFKKFKDTEGIAKATTFKFVSKKPGKIKAERPKLGMLMNAYNAGGIDSLLSEPTFTKSRTAQMKALHSLASAVGAMHQQQCTHGDIKPGNLLANFDKKNPKGIEVGLSDFGMAIDFSKDLKDQSVQEGGGTKGFQGPEVNKDLAGMSDDDKKTHFEGLDRYAFGITAFSLLTGKHDVETFQSFRNDSWKNYTEDHVESFISSLRNQPGVPDEVVDLLKRSLDATPANRPLMSEWIPHLANATSAASKLE